MRPLRTLAFVLAAIAIAVVAMQSIPSRNGRPRHLDMAELTRAAGGQEIVKATWRGSTLEGFLKDGTAFVTVVPEMNSMGSTPVQELLLLNHVNWENAEPSSGRAALSILAMFALPLLIVGAAYFLILRPAGRSFSTEARIDRLEQALAQAQAEISQLREALRSSKATSLSS